MKVAKLVYVSLCTRVIIEDNASEDEIIAKAKEQLKDKIETDLGDNIEGISFDEECPYDPKIDKE